MKYKSEWFKGLLFAEHVGPIEAKILLAQHEFYDNVEFQNGVIDYISYYSLQLKEK